MSGNTIKVIAINSSHNEEDVIHHVFGDRIANGLDDYLIDNRSTDGTVKAASAWLGKGLLKIERFPRLRWRRASPISAARTSAVPIIPTKLSSAGVDADAGA